MRLGPGLDAVLVVLALAHLIAVLLLCIAVMRPERGAHSESIFAGAPALVSFGIAGAVAVQLGFDQHVSIVVAAWGCAVATLAIRRAPHFSWTGALTWGSYVLLSAASGIWGIHFLLTLSVSTPTRLLLWSAAVLVAVTIPSSLIQTLEGWETVLRHRWLTPRDPLVAWAPNGAAPRVSIHVPTHSEPPEMVMATLDRLAALDYANFEVLVIDNNTADQNLWRPVDRHCQRLGDRFRFFHVEGIAGAKAGALNWALERTDPAATVVAVVDADYQVDPAWLLHTVGYFDDPKIGFVQCPHAYRDYHQSRFGRMANAEYSVFFATGMVSLSERGAGITVGTMSGIRRAVLEEAGGWAEWCLTEDSELAIRIHALGYRSVYLSTAYGWGLIPQTFDGYKQQRFRWTYGPIQELKHHLRLFTALGSSRSSLRPRQRIHHANHGLDVAMSGLRLGAVAVAGAALASMVAHNEVVTLPYALWIAATIVLVSSVTMRLLIYTRAVGQRLREALGGAVAYLALSHVISIASIKALTGRSAPWRRTDKFSRGDDRVVLGSGVLAETGLAAACLVIALVALVALPHGGVGTALAIGIAWQGLSYGAAPFVACLAACDVRREQAARDDVTCRIDPAPIVGQAAEA